MRGGRVRNSKQEKPEIAGNFFNRVRTILEKENIQYDQKVLATLINKHFPDWRRVLNELQRYSVGGSIDSAILASFSDVSVSELLKFLKEKDFQEVRKWVVNNLDNDPSVLLRRIYDALATSLKVLALLLLCSLLLSISIKLPSLPTKRLIFWRR